MCDLDRDDLVRLRQARDQVDREYASPLDVEALARTALMSSGHFSRSFRAARGESPYGYLMTRAEKGLFGTAYRMRRNSASTVPT